MSKNVLIIFIILALSGCAVVSWKHSTKGYGEVSTLSTKGSAEFMRDYQDCNEVATRYTDDHEDSYNPCIAAREHTRCMKEKYGWVIDKNVEK
jgi:uncharacterized protein YceK